MSKSPLALLSGFLVAAACLAPAAAHAGTAQTTFVVSAHVVDACVVAVDGHTSHSAPAGLSTACSSGAASLGGVGVDGVASARGKGAPSRVTSVHQKRAAGGEWVVVTVSF